MRSRRLRTRGSVTPSPANGPRVGSMPCLDHVMAAITMTMKIITTARQPPTIARRCSLQASRESRTQRCPERGVAERHGPRCRKGQRRDDRQHVRDRRLLAGRGVTYSERTGGSEVVEGWRDSIDGSARCGPGWPSGFHRGVFDTHLPPPSLAGRARRRAVGELAQRWGGVTEQRHSARCPNVPSPQDGEVPSPCAASGRSGWPNVQNARIPSPTTSGARRRNRAPGTVRARSHAECFEPVLPLEVTVGINGTRHRR